MRRDLRNSHHLATVSFDGRFWDAYLELVETPGPGQPARGRIAFSAADAGDVEPVRTTTIFIEDSPQEVVVRAREFKTHQLVALLRSAIPPDPSPPDGPSPTADGPAASEPSSPSEASPHPEPAPERGPAPDPASEPDDAGRADQGEPADDR